MTINKKFTNKDLSTYLGVSIQTAKKYLKDIKIEYDIKLVTEHHIKKYYKVE